MLILLRDTDLDGQPIIGSGLLIPGENALEIVQKMQATSPFNAGEVTDYIRDVLNAAGDKESPPIGPPENAAPEFLERLARRGLVEFVKEPENYQARSAQLENALLAVRESGLANMFDHPQVACLARAFGYPEVAEWIEKNPAVYTRCLLSVGFRPLQDNFAEEGNESCADKRD